MLPIRTFIAVNISPSVASRVAKLIAQMRASPASVKWVGEDNFHFTLQFLGDVEPERIPEICHGVQDAVAEVEPFEMMCQGVGAFPNLDRPRTLWLGVRNGADEMCELQRRIEQAMSALGFRPEARQFHPHLTLGRVKRGMPADLEQMLEGRQDYHAGSTEVSEVVVYSSQLKREGPAYAALCRAALGVA